MKTMLITGTTQGIGNALYEYFKNSYNVISVNRRVFKGENIICDLSNISEVEELADLIRKKNIDILINNAGGATPVEFVNLDSTALIKCSNLNYHAPVLLMQAVLSHMQQQKKGRIVNISSIASKSPRPLIPHYGAAKSALEKFSTSMAVAYGGCGITVNCVCPGGVETENSINNRRKMAKISGLKTDFINENIKNKNGLERMIVPSEIVRVVEFLISEEASAISGQVLNVCGVSEVH